MGKWVSVCAATSPADVILVRQRIGGRQHIGGRPYPVLLLQILHGVAQPRHVRIAEAHRVPQPKQLDQETHFRDTHATKQGGVPSEILVAESGVDTCHCDALGLAQLEDGGWDYVSRFMCRLLQL